MNYNFFAEFYIIINMKNLKSSRTGKHLSQAEVAERLGIPRATYQSYENGRNEPNIETLIKLADFFNVSVDTLIGHDADLVDLRAVNKNQRYAIEKLVNSLTDEQVGEIVGHIKTFK